MEESGIHKISTRPAPKFECNILNPNGILAVRSNLLERACKIEDEIEIIIAPLRKEVRRLRDVANKLSEIHERLNED